jgi:hypothetical protein
MLQIVAQRNGFIYTDPPIIVPSIATLFKKGPDILASLPKEQHVNLYYTLAHHSGATGAEKPQRTSATFEYQTILAFDIDKGPDQARAFDYVAAVAEVLDAPKDSFIVVKSGNGIHVIAHLKHPIRQATYFRQNKPHYVEICSKIQKLMGDRGLPGSMDTGIFDPARVLRLPGTTNQKPNIPDTRCELLQYADVQLDLDLKSVSGLGDIEKENVTPTELRRQYPNPDFPEVVKGCQFIQWTINETADVHEPHVFDLFSLLAPMPPAGKIEVKGQEMTPVELADHVFKGATSSRSLQRQHFDDKWAQATKYGARKCDTINQRWGKCQSCPHFGKIPTPLAIKGPDHVGSENLGYWVLNDKGKHGHPHYEDLAKVFGKERAFITTSAERIYAFQQSHYLEMPPIQVKGWLERRVTPVDPLREAHRAEFVAKIKVKGALTEMTEAELFGRAIEGKLNCKNGVLNIVTGELAPHSPQAGFQYVLPYDYEAGQASEYFMDWLAVITQSRTELMETILRHHGLRALAGLRRPYVLLLRRRRKERQVHADSDHRGDGGPAESQQRESVSAHRQPLRTRSTRG